MLALAEGLTPFTFVVAVVVVLVEGIVPGRTGRRFSFKRMGGATGRKKQERRRMERQGPVEIMYTTPSYTTAGAGPPNSPDGLG